MEDEWEEEEQFVVAELSGIISSDFLSSRQGTCKIVDIDSEQPMMQVGRYVFAGEYEDAIGTCVIFEEGHQSSTDSSPALKYKCHTMKKLMLQRTFLSERKEDEPVSNRIEVLALNEEVYGRKSSICAYLDPTETSVLDESKDCEDPEMNDESTAEMDETEAGTSSLQAEETIDTTMNLSRCSALEEGDDSS